MTEDKYGTRNIQSYLLPILDDIDHICRKNGIEYSLMGGGLLGAIRHRGFVPWDDDLDIIFSRENYEQFLEVCKTQLPPQYTIIGSIWVKRITRKDNPKLEEEEGCIDLFVFDNIPENKFVRSMKHFLLKTLQGMLKVQRHYDGLSLMQKSAVAVTHVIGLMFSKRIKLSLYSTVSQWGNRRHCRYVNNYVTYYSMISTKRYEKADTLEFIDMDFENRKVRVFKNYDNILKAQFGDYHILPPDEKQRPTHIKDT